MAQAQRMLLRKTASMGDEPKAKPKGRAYTGSRKATKSYIVCVEWLDEEVYLATSEDIKGLVLQTDTLDEMEKEMRECIPWLLEGNHNIHVSPKDLSIKRDGKKTGSKVTYTLTHSIPVQ